MKESGIMNKVNHVALSLFSAMSLQSSNMEVDGALGQHDNDFIKVSSFEEAANMFMSLENTDLFAEDKYINDLVGSLDDSNLTRFNEIVNYSDELKTLHTLDQNGTISKDTTKGLFSVDSEHEATCGDWAEGQSH
jgi:hypothetical protein